MQGHIDSKDSMLATESDASSSKDDSGAEDGELHDELWGDQFDARKFKRGGHRVAEKYNTSCRVIWTPKGVVTASAMRSVVVPHIAAAHVWGFTAQKRTLF